MVTEKAEELRMAVFERKVLRKIYGPHFDAQTNEWRKLERDKKKKTGLGMTCLDET